MQLLQQLLPLASGPGFSTIPPVITPSPIMPAESLPAEVLRMVFLQLDDHCFAWFILRRVSHFWRSVAEDVFAKHLIENSVITFAGDYARTVVNNHFRRTGTETADAIAQANFVFKGVHFDAGRAKKDLVLKLVDEPSTYSIPVDIATPGKKPLRTYHDTQQFVARWSCCTCTPQITTVDEVAGCNCLALIFFSQDHNALDVLKTTSHFWRYDKELRSVQIPSIKVDAVKQEISLDWRQLLQKSYSDQLKERRILKPWLRDCVPCKRQAPLKYPLQRMDLTHPSFESTAELHYGMLAGGEQLHQVSQDEKWIFWDAPERDANVLHMDGRHLQSPYRKTFTSAPSTVDTSVEPLSFEKGMPRNAYHAPDKRH